MEAKYVKKLCQEIMRKGCARGFDFFLEEKNKSTVLTAMQHISNEAYLGEVRNDEAELTVSIMKDYIGINITAHAKIIDDPYCSKDIEPGEPFVVNENRIALGSILFMEKVLKQGTGLIFNKIGSLEEALEMNIRHNLMKVRREQFQRKKETMQKSGNADVDETLFHYVRSIVEADMDRRLAQCILKFSETNYPEELLPDFKRAYYSDTKLDFEIEKDEQVKVEKYREITLNSFQLGDPVPSMLITPYALDAYTAGQWIYMFYYGCKGEAWFDYTAYCAKYDKDEEARLEETYKRCRTLCEMSQEEAK